MLKVNIGRIKDFKDVIGYLSQFIVPKVGRSLSFKENIYIKIIAIQKAGIENPIWEKTFKNLKVFFLWFLARIVPKGIDTTITIIRVVAVITKVVKNLDLISSSTV